MTRCIFLMGLCVFFCVGCKKAVPTATATKVNVGGDAGGAAAAGEGNSGRNSVLQVPFDDTAKVVLLNIGRNYQMASIANGKAPKDAVELDAGKMKTLRDMQEHEVEVAYGVDVKKLGDDPGSFMLAWEKTPTNDGYRLVLMADFTTIKYVAQAEFERMKKAK